MIPELFRTHRPFLSRVAMAVALGLTQACFHPSDLTMPANPFAPQPPVPAAPVLRSQPADVAVTVGMSATFTVYATGYPLNYQWFRNGVALSAPGAGSVYVLSAATLADNGATFKVTVSNGLGTVTSAEATLTVTSAPTLSALAGTPWTAGAGPALGFVRPQALWAGWDGTILVADTGASMLQRITSGSLVADLAGSAGTPGAADGPGPLARFRQPGGVVRDGFGNVFVADTGNHTIRKVSREGLASVWAGSAGVAGSADGAGTLARFNQPTGLAFDLYGNLLVADTGNHTIRSVDARGNVGTVAGLAGVSGHVDGNGRQALFASPAGIAAYDAWYFDLDGTVVTDEVLYVTDTGNDAIRTISYGGQVGTLAGGTLRGLFQDGTGAAAGFNGPTGLAVDGQGTAFVADSGNQVIRRVDTGGRVTTLAGQPGQAGSADGTGAAAQFHGPMGLSQDQRGNLLVADAGNGLIRRVTGQGVVTTLSGQPPASGSADGTGAAASFHRPLGLAVDGAGRVLVADAMNHTIRAVTSAGQVTTLAGTAGTPGAVDGTSGTFFGPAAVAAAPSGALYVADWLNSTIRVIAPSGAVSTLAGVAGVTGKADGPGAQATFNHPRSLALDGGGNLYVADTGNGAVRMVSPAGLVTTPPALQVTSVPTCVAADAAGNVWIGSAGGVVACSVGGARTTYLPPGQGFLPTALALGRDGALFAADALNPVVWQLTKVPYAYNFQPLLGSLGAAGFTAGPLVPGAAANTLPSANGLAFDPVSGNLYVSTTEAILKVAF
jgi:sugar lactone lactonase YvrE